MSYNITFQKRGREMGEKIIYEVLRVIDGKPIFLENHFRRMENSFKLIGEEFSLSYEKISNAIYELIKNEGKLEGNIKSNLLNYTQPGIILADLGFFGSEFEN